jgi:hypothetical protein
VAASTGCSKFSVEPVEDACRVLLVRLWWSSPDFVLGKGVRSGGMDKIHTFVGQPACSLREQLGLACCLLEGGGLLRTVLEMGRVSIQQFW